MKYYLAIDIGASSGRHIVGWLEDNTICTKEIYRFDNGVKEENGHLVWDINYLESKVRKGIDLALSMYKIESLSIDTWGVDYVLLNNDEVIYIHRKSAVEGYDRVVADAYTSHAGLVQLGRK